MFSVLESENKYRTFIENYKYVVTSACEICHSLECDPSHSGLFSLALQPQKNTFLLSSAVYFCGLIPVSLCDPSQNG